MPKTILGKWSVGLIIVMPLLIMLGGSLSNTLYKDVAAGETILKDVAARPMLALTMLAGMLSGISSFVVGLLAIIKRKERSPLVFISTIVGALLMLFLIGEFVGPTH
ncbi:MAG: hypothetical protein V1907_02115 [Candidatus Kerfeldbacteria bacterium]